MKRTTIILSFLLTVAFSPKAYPQLADSAKVKTFLKSAENLPFNSALPAFNEAEKIARQIGWKEGVVRVRYAKMQNATGSASALTSRICIEEFKEVLPDAPLSMRPHYENEILYFQALQASLAGNTPSSEAYSIAHINRLLNEGGTDYFGLYADYHNLANVQIQKGDYTAALNSYYRLTDIVHKSAPNDYVKQMSLSSIMGRIQEKLGNDAGASYYYARLGDLAARYIPEKKGKIAREDSNTVATMLITCVNFYHRLAKIDSAKMYFQKAAPYLIKGRLEINFKLAKAKLACAERDFKSAEALFSDILAQNIENKTTAVNVHKETAIMYAAKGDPEKALLSVQSALNLLLGAFKNDDYRYTPTWEETKNGQLVTNKKVLSEVLLLKLKLTHALPSADSTRILFETALFAMHLVDNIRQAYNFDADIKMLMRESYAIFEELVDNGFTLYQAQKEEKHLKIAFEASERARALLLLLAYNTDEAEATLVAQDRDQLYDLKYAVSRLENQIYALGKNAGDPNIAKNSLDSLHKELTRQRAALEAFLQNIRKNNPNYFDLRYRAQFITLEEAQKKLIPDDATLALEYFQSTHHLYCFALERGKARFYKITPESGWLRDLEAFNAFCAQPKGDMAQLTTIGQNIYRQLLEKPIVERSKAAKNLEQIIVVPDRNLNTLAFEALTSTELAIGAESRPFLVHQYAFSYAYSFSHLQKQMETETNRAGKIFAGFAPLYTEGSASTVEPVKTRRKRPNATPLPYLNNAQEVREVQQILGSGDVFVGTQASETQFMAQAADYRVLLLAMHAVLDPENPQFSNLVFNNPDGETYDSLLTVNELYSAQLKADLAVVGACNSGSGRVSRGEDIESISRGFVFAGTPAVVMSLWQVPDEETRKIMGAFFANLKAGMPKNKALQEAKKAYLSTCASSERMSPLYWAGFIVSGNLEPVELTKKWWSDGLIWVCGLLGSVLLAYLWLMRPRREAQIA